MELWHFLCCQPTQAFELPIELPVIWDATIFLSCHCKALININNTVIVVKHHTYSSVSDKLRHFCKPNSISLKKICRFSSYSWLLLNTYEEEENIMKLLINSNAEKFASSDTKVMIELPLSCAKPFGRIAVSVHIDHWPLGDLNVILKM